jgi:hypothetical protein
MDCPKDLPVLHCKKREITRKLIEVVTKRYTRNVLMHLFREQHKE